MAFTRRHSKPPPPADNPAEKKLRHASPVGNTAHTSSPSPSAGVLTVQKPTGTSSSGRGAVTTSHASPTSLSSAAPPRIASLASAARRSSPESLPSSKANKTPASATTSSTTTASSTAKKTSIAPLTKPVTSSTAQARKDAPPASSHDSSTRSMSSINSTGGSQPAASPVVASWTASAKPLPSTRASLLAKATTPAATTTLTATTTQAATTTPAATTTLAAMTTPAATRTPATTPAAMATATPLPPPQQALSMPSRIAAVAAAKGPVASVLRKSGYKVRSSPEETGEGEDGDDGRIVWSAPLSDDDMSDSGTPVRGPAARSFDMSPPQRQRLPFYSTAKRDGGPGASPQEKGEAGAVASPDGHSDTSASPMMSPGMGYSAYEAADEQEDVDSDEGPGGPGERRLALGGWLSAAARGDPVVKDAVKETIAARARAVGPSAGADFAQVPGGGASATGDEGSDVDVEGEVEGDTASASSHTRSAGESLEDVDDDFDLTEEERRAEREIAREALLTGGDVGYLETVLEESMEGVESVGSASSPGHGEHTGQGVTHLEGLEEEEEGDADAESSRVGGKGEAGDAGSEDGGYTAEEAKGKLGRASREGSWEDRHEVLVRADDVHVETPQDVQEEENVADGGMVDGVEREAPVRAPLGGQSGAHGRAQDGGAAWASGGQAVGEEPEEQGEDWMDQMIRREMEHRGRFWEQAKKEDELVSRVGLEHIRMGGMGAERAGEGHGPRGQEHEDDEQWQPWGRAGAEEDEEEEDEEEEELSVRGSRIGEGGLLEDSLGVVGMDDAGRGKDEQRSGKRVGLQVQGGDGGADDAGEESEGSVNFGAGPPGADSDEEEEEEEMQMGGVSGSDGDEDGHSATGKQEWNVVQENSLYHESVSGDEEEEEDSRSGEFSPSGWHEDGDDEDEVDATRSGKRTHSLKRAAAAAAAEAARAKEQVRALQRAVGVVGAVGMRAATGVDRAVSVLEKVTVAALAVGDAAVGQLTEGIARVGRVLDEIAVVPGDGALQPARGDHVRLKGELEAAAVAAARSAEEIRELKSSLKLSQAVSSGLCTELEAEAAKLRARVGELESECDVLRQQLELSRDETPRSASGRSAGPFATGIILDRAGGATAVAREDREVQTDSVPDAMVANAGTDMAGAGVPRGAEGAAEPSRNMAPGGSMSPSGASNKDSSAGAAEAEAALAESRARVAELSALLAEEKQTSARLQARLTTGEGRLQENAKLQKSLEEALSSANWQVADLTASMASMKDTELSQGRRIAALERQKQEAEQHAARLTASVKELEAREKAREAAPAAAVAAANDVRDTTADEAILAGLAAMVEDAVRNAGKRLQMASCLPPVDGCPHKTLWESLHVDEPESAGKKEAVSATSSSEGTGPTTASLQNGGVEGAKKVASGAPPPQAAKGDALSETQAELTRYASCRVVVKSILGSFSQFSANLPSFRQLWPVLGSYDQYQAARTAAHFHQLLGIGGSCALDRGLHGDWCGMAWQLHAAGCYCCGLLPGHASVRAGSSLLRSHLIMHAMTWS
eukprot:jgi/Mesvir1/3383/Mv05086-RA.4